MAEAGLYPNTLTCEYLAEPMGLDVTQPRLSWTLASDERSQVQSAYRVQVASSVENLERDQPDLWDSGPVQSSRSIQVPYEGKPLTSRQVCYWRVRVWDAAEQVSPWSDPARWEMGLLASEDWSARWIGAGDVTRRSRDAARAAEVPSPPPIVPTSGWIWHPIVRTPLRSVYFRKTFELPEDVFVEDSRIQMTVDGYYVLYVNGHIVGSNSLWQELNEYDVTELLQSGENVVAVEACKSRLQEGLFFGMQVRYDEGKGFDMFADTTWRTSSRAVMGWNQPGYEDLTWLKAVFVENAPKDEWGPVPRYSNQHDNLLPAPMFRKPFTVDAKVARARLYVCGLGYYEFYLNGSKVGDHVLDPGQTNYEQVAMYATYDVTDAIRNGENVAGMILGDGWYNQCVVWEGQMVYGPPCGIAQIEITYQDGSRDVVGTDGTWRVTGDGPIRENNIHVGEVYDARREMPNWSAPGFDAATWSPAEEVASPTQRLAPQLLPSIKVTREIEPAEIITPKPGVHVFDMGQNFAGWVRLRLKAPAGTRITLRFGECIDRHGFLDTSSTGVFATKVIQTDEYICKGGGVEEWEPRFTYHGFQYVAVTGYPHAPTRDMVRGMVVHTAVEQPSRFTCSDGLLNRIHEAALWSQLSNLHSLPTDCPARERCGWLGDAHCAAELNIYNFHMPQVYIKYMRDLVTSLGTADITFTGRSLAPGVPPNVAPGKRTCGEARPDWGSAIMQIPWYMYRYYGDERILADHYEEMTRWVEYLREMAEDHIIPDGWGDWCAPDTTFPECLLPPEQNGTPVPLTSTAHYYFDVRILAAACQLLGHAEKLEEYALLADQIKAAFIGRFFDAERCTFGTQTANAMALHFGLVPEARIPDVARALVADVVDKNRYHFTVGIHGQRHLYRQLTHCGRGDVAVGVFRVEDYPGFVDLFSLGATTLWEMWGAGADRVPPGYSCNHPMQGGYDPWFYQCLGGINLAHDRTAFGHLVLRPDLNNDLEWVKVSHQCMYGRIVSEWRREDQFWHWHVEIPANTTSTVYIPITDVDHITEGGLPLAESPGVRFMRIEDGQTVLSVGSGTYDFVIR